MGDFQGESDMLYQNLVHLHRRQAERFGPRPALRWKRHGVWHDLAWDAYREQALACAAALVDVGVAPGDRVGLLAENRVEWLVADMGIMTAGAVNVPPHAPLTARQVLEKQRVRRAVAACVRAAESTGIRRSYRGAAGAVACVTHACADAEPQHASRERRERRARGGDGPDERQCGEPTGAGPFVWSSGAFANWGHGSCRYSCSRR